MKPKCLEGVSVNQFLKASELNKMIYIGGMIPQSFISKMEREGSPLKVWKTIDGKKRYSLAEIVAKANAKFMEIESVEERNEKRAKEEMRALAHKDWRELNSDVFQKYKVFHDEISSKITGDTLLSESQIIGKGRYFSPDEAIGVYFLIKDKSIVYVGQSVNVFNRVGQHRHDKDFDGFKYINCRKIDLDVLESLYIHFLKPKYNGHAPIPFQDLLSKIEWRQ